MKQSKSFIIPMVVGVVSLIAGAVLVTVSWIGFVLMLCGVILMCIPVSKGHAPHTEVADGKLRIRGAFADWTLDISKLENIRTMDKIDIVVMSLGYGGHRYIGGEFVENTLGGIYIAADKKIPMYIVAECEDKVYVFNDTDLETTEAIYARLSDTSC